MIGTGIFFINKKLSAVDKISESIFFVKQLTVFIPLAAVYLSTTDVCDGIDDQVELIASVGPEGGFAVEWIPGDYYLSDTVRLHTAANSAIADSASSGETVAEGQAQMFPIGMLPTPEP